MAKPSIASCICIHDDHWFVPRAVASFAPAGPVVAFVTTTAWNGSPGNFQRCVEAASEAGAEVILGDWPDESLHRRTALRQMKERGFRHVFIPDGDEIIEPALLESLLDIARTCLAERVNVSMDTYWKSPEYVIRPREALTPAILLDLEHAEHLYIREYRGGRLITLGPEYGVLHHLSYCGPDDRIERKIATWSHKHEVVEGWWQRVWQGWDGDRLMRNLHPTHPGAYGMAERIAVPEILEQVPDGRTRSSDPERPAPWPKVSIVIPLYGGPEHIEACLGSLTRCADLVHEIIVVDDLSPDDAPGVAQSFRGVKLLRNEENLGFAATCNKGFSESSGEVAIFLNSDTIVPRAGLIRLVESLIESGTVAATGPFSNVAGYHQRTSTTYTDVANLDLFAQDFAWRDVEDIEVDMLVGFCLAVKRAAIEEVGLFDSRFGRGFFEDNDLCYRLRRAGYKLKVAARAFIHHTGSQSIGALDTHPNALLARNRRIFDDKWAEDLESGFASHLSGQIDRPITFRAERKPEAVHGRLCRQAARAGISLCMIVRNEERVIAECLRSARGAFSQMIVVDTGSSDRTPELARELGADVREHAWEDSFSAARNHSLSYAKGKWVFWMDADDTLPLATCEALQKAAIEAPDDITGFIVPVQFVEEGPGAGTRVDHLKLFRNLPGLRFEGRIHEQILPSLRERPGRIARLDAVVLHSGYDTSAEGQAKKRERDEKLLKLDLEERPDHPFVLFNLGMTAHYTGRHEEAVSRLRESIEHSDPLDSHVRKAYALIGRSLALSGRPEDALSAYEEGLAAVGDDPELRFNAAMALSELGRFAEAKAQYERVSPLPPDRFSSMDIGVLSFKRDHNLAVVHLALGEYARAKSLLMGAIAASPGFQNSGLALFDAAMEREDLRTGAEVIQLLRSRSQGADLWVKLAVQLEEARGGDPIALLARTVESDPFAVAPRLALAQRMLESGYESDAVPHLELLDQLGCPAAVYFRGVLASRHGRFDEALRHMKRARDLNPGHEETARQIAALEAACAVESEREDS